MASLNDIETKIQSIIDKLNIKTIAGVLPLTFTAKDGTAADWVIYGNNNQQGVGERTENLFDGATIQKGIIYNGVPSYAQDTVSASFDNGIITFTTQNSGYRGVYFDFIEIDDTYTVSIKNAVCNGTAYLLIDYYDENKTYISRQSGTVPSSYPHQKSYTPPASTKYVRVSIQNNNIGAISVEQLMLIKGSTPPSSYEPFGYQIPISVNGTPQTFYIGSTPLTAGQSISKTSTGVDIDLFEGENTISTTLYNKPKIKIYYKWR